MRPSVLKENFKGGKGQCLVIRRIFHNSSYSLKTRLLKSYSFSTIVGNFENQCLCYVFATSQSSC